MLLVRVGALVDSTASGEDRQRFRRGAAVLGRRKVVRFGVGGKVGEAAGHVVVRTRSKTWTGEVSQGAWKPMDRVAGVART